jgi:hypothetical protein
MVYNQQIRSPQALMELFISEPRRDCMNYTCINIDREMWINNNIQVESVKI